MSDGAKKVWRRLAPELERYQLISVVFTDAFEDLCETIADVKMLRRALRAREALLQSKGEDQSKAWEARTPNGMSVQSPLVLNLRNARADMQRLLDKFGLSPAEQARVSTAARAQLSFDLVPPDSAPQGDGLPQGFADF